MSRMMAVRARGTRRSGWWARRKAGLRKLSRKSGRRRMVVRRVVRKYKLDGWENLDISIVDDC